MVHVLLRTRKPSSQSREQDDHGPQAAQPPLSVCGDALPLRRSSSTRAGDGRRDLSEASGAPRASGPPHPPPPSRPAPPSGAARHGARRGCTVGVARSGAVGRARSRLRPPPAKLQAVRVGQGRAAREAESLLLPRPALRHVHRQPRRPRRVAPHLGAALGVARLELLRGGGGFRAPRPPRTRAPRSAPRAPRPSPRRSPGRSCRSRRPDAATARRRRNCCCTCSRSPRRPRRWEQGRACFRYRTWGGGRASVILGRSPEPLRGRGQASPKNTGGWSRAHRSSRLLPTQTRPPWRGAGLLQLRWRTWKPIPQDVLHWAHDDHGLHAPFLEGWEETGRCPSDP